MEPVWFKFEHNVKLCDFQQAHVYILKSAYFLAKLQRIMFQNS